MTQQAVLLEDWRNITRKINAWICSRCDSSKKRADQHRKTDDPGHSDL